MLSALRIMQRFGSLNAQYQLNKSKNAVRFEAQNIIWDYDEVNYQTNAFSKGLASLNFQKNDNFLIRVPSSQQAESFIAKVGTAVIGANLIISKGNTESQIDSQIQNNNARGIIFEPTLSVGQNLFIDVLNNLIPELAQTRNGQKIKSSRYGSLAALIQTNFYSYPGVYKFRSMLNYADDKYFKLSSQEHFEPLSLPSSSNTLFVTQPASDFGFKAGVLNSNINGRYLVVAEPHQVNKIAEYHKNNVDLIATQEIANLHPDINVFVQRGSQLFQGRNKRTEI